MVQSYYFTDQMFYENEETKYRFRWTSSPPQRTQVLHLKQVKPKKQEKN